MNTFSKGDQVVTTYYSIENLKGVVIGTPITRVYSDETEHLYPVNFDKIGTILVNCYNLAKVDHSAMYDLWWLPIKEKINILRDLDKIEELKKAKVTCLACFNIGDHTVKKELVGSSYEVKKQVEDIAKILNCKSYSTETSRLHE